MKYGEIITFKEEELLPDWIKEWLTFIENKKEKL
jgi:hypothetical protein